MEASNQRFVVEKLGTATERASTKGDPEFTTDIVSATDVRSKSVNQGFHGCKGIFGTV